MPKLFIILAVSLVLAACASTSTDQLAKYQGQSSSQILQTAKADLARGYYQRAVNSLQALITIYPFGEDAEQAQLDIIYAYYKNGNKVEALAAADRFIRLYPRNPHVDYAYYIKGMVNMGSQHWALLRWLYGNPAEHDLSDMKAAFSDFSTLVQIYPNSQYAPAARKHMLYIRNLLAEHNYLIAKFYYDHKAYVAAANRASIVVLHYEGSPSVIPALGIMVKSYRALGETELANQTLDILARSYPDSSVYRRLR